MNIIMTSFIPKRLFILSRSKENGDQANGSIDEVKSQGRRKPIVERKTKR